MDPASEYETWGAGYGLVVAIPVTMTIMMKYKGCLAVRGPGRLAVRGPYVRLAVRGTLKS